MKDIIRNFIYYIIILIGKILPDTEKCNRIYLCILYKYKMKKKLNIDNPKLYNEKLQWLKIYDRNPIYPILVDKYEAKKYVKEIIGEEYIIPTLGIWDNFEDIDFDSLPMQFVMKCTHDSGGLVICRNKKNLDIDNAHSKINHSLKRNYFKNTREWPYKNVKPRIIAEEFISLDKTKIPVDYKFFCFNGEIDSVMVCLDRENGKPKFVFFDLDWNRLNYQYVEENILIEEPKNFSEMKSIVKKLSRGFNEIRIDLYNLDGKIYFGEFTFYNQSGLDRDISLDVNKIWGKKVELKKYEK